MDCLPQLHVAAIHAEPGYNSVVPGLAILCKEDNVLLSTGIYQNSIGKRSNYIVGGQYLGSINKIRYGYIAGIVDGYAVNDGNAIPMAAAIVSIPLDNMQIHLTFIPPVPHYTPMLVQFSVSF
jgi:hypothetical protein